MVATGHPQRVKLEQLIRAAEASRSPAARGMLFCTGRGLALVNAAFDLFECDGLYDLAADVTHELSIQQDPRR